MKFQHKSSLTKSEKEHVLNLWNNEFPEKTSKKSLTEFDKYLESLEDKNFLLLTDTNENIKGFYFDFLRENEIWFSIILDSSIHGKGFGTKILNLAKELQEELNGWVIDKNNEIKKNGKTYNSPLEFYLKNNFKIIPDKKLEFDSLSAIKIHWKK
ncbi:GNAT family N-acetyltransferase [Aureivirga sp. CE67]|uniref:GNAT family N-acetyltransferase n=1 Tax=Aureivirga sp. CE67 TaxID=1788983 RepID=UPI0018C97110|nr:GNAT family N-acetyltransferase [Aureivirga sp. CE67]